MSLTSGLFAVLVLLNLLDVLTTVRGLAAGRVETNPILSRAFEAFGILPTVLILKGAFLGLLYLQRAQVPLWVLCALVVGYALVCTNNLYQLSKDEP